MNKSTAAAEWRGRPFLVNVAVAVLLAYIHRRLGMPEVPSLATWPAWCGDLLAVLGSGLGGVLYTAKGLASRTTCRKVCALLLSVLASILLWRAYWSLATHDPIADWRPYIHDLVGAAVFFLGYASTSFALAILLSPATLVGYVVQLITSCPPEQDG